jgi:hydrogenase maturation factor HypF (carbamoyltransferase family)
MAAEHREGRRLHIWGTVQGVGLRPRVCRTAHLRGISGWARNDSAGVTIDAVVDDAALSRFVALKNPPRTARILTVDPAAIAAESPADSAIVARFGGAACPV